MTISLYDVSVANYLQGLAGLSGVLDKGLAYCKETGIDPETIVETRLIADMQPFRFQVHQVTRHSLGAIQGLKAGQFGPGMAGKPDDSYAALQALVAETLLALQKLTPAEVNAHTGADMMFAAGERRVPFTAEGFILSFSLPNFYFHATTTYDILRMKGVPVGKRDYMGGLRMKG